MTGPAPAIGIAAASAVSAFGIGWRGLAAALRNGQSYLRPSTELAVFDSSLLAAEAFAIPPAIDSAERRARMLMSRSALLASVAVGNLLAEAGPGWSAPRDEIGFFLGVGASGGAMDQLESMLAASIEGENFSLPLFGQNGLRACNPLYAFQLMNNFTLCHSAIRYGTGGPTAALFSRGTGTVLALSEAVAAMEEGDCLRALVGGADSSTHPVTWAELRREGFVAAGLIPGEAAAVVALTTCADESLAQIERCTIHAARHCSLATALAEALQSMAIPDGVVIAPWGTPPRQELRNGLRTRFGALPIVDVSAALGDSLAATAALAWLVALDLLLVETEWRRVLVLSAGVDGDLGVTVLSRGEKR